MAKRAALKRQVGALWQQAVHQLDDVRKVVKRRSGRLEADVARLRMERDKLLALLGEQTYKLANQDKVALPTIVQRTVERLNEVIAALAPSNSVNGHAHEDDEDEIVEAKAKKPAKRRPAAKKSSRVSKSAN